MIENSTEGWTKILIGWAASGKMTLTEAVKRLQQDAHLRTVRETLSRYCGVPESDESRLKSTVVSLLMKSDPDAKRDSEDRKVRNWMKDETQFIGKDSAIKLAFSLGLSPEDADEMVRRLSGERFHWRNPEDIIWLFCLDKGMSYSQAKRLYQKREEMVENRETQVEDPDTMTALVKQRVILLQTEKELMDFLAASQEELGTMHNTAYTIFREFMNLLKTPDPEADSFFPDIEKDKPFKERRMGANEIVATYLYNRYIPRVKRGGKKQRDDKGLVYSAIQRDIRQNWPDEVALSRMENRETDVTRKVLILLFLACDGGEGNYGDDSFDTPENVFQATYIRLNSMLLDCGFGALDSRVPFDWMVLYCICADENILIDENIQNFLSSIFPIIPESEANT